MIVATSIVYKGNWEGVNEVLPRDPTLETRGMANALTSFSLAPSGILQSGNECPGDKHEQRGDEDGGIAESCVERRLLDRPDGSHQDPLDPQTQ